LEQDSFVVGDGVAEDRWDCSRCPVVAEPISRLAARQVLNCAAIPALAGRACRSESAAPEFCAVAGVLAVAEPVVETLNDRSELRVLA
jgi:hypothetical protein